MADPVSTTEDSAEKAYAAAAAAAPKPAAAAASAPVAAAPEVVAPEVVAVVKEVPAKPAVVARKAATANKVASPAKPAATKPAATKPAATKPAAAKVAKAKPAAKKSVAAARPVKAAAITATKAQKAHSTITKLKDKIMATKTPDFTAAITETVNSAVTEMQSKAQAAYDKGTEAVTEMTAFAKGNVEAVVESSKVLAEGVQGMGKTFADEAKTAYETATADLKEMAAVKSPTDLFALQGKILRRNFDAMVAATSKNTDATLKLANDVFAPISGRVNLAAEKLAKVA